VAEKPLLHKAEERSDFKLLYLRNGITADRPENIATVVAGMEINPSSSDNTHFHTGKAETAQPHMWQ